MPASKTNEQANHDPQLLPANLPHPVDDGLASHLVDAQISAIAMPCTDGSMVRLDELLSNPTVLFFYPRTGVPGQPPGRGFLGEDWNDIPGARGCTPQNCGYRDTYTEFKRLGVRVYGVSTQTTEFQREFKEGNHVPFDYLSDAALHLVRAMRLPTFEFLCRRAAPRR